MALRGVHSELREMSHFSLWLGTVDVECCVTERPEERLLSSSLI